MDNSNVNVAEHQQISTALEVERLETNLFRSKSLWKPARGRGVFGGQVISQALVSATNCIHPEYALHSLHCYFLASASPATPIVYFVERLRQGRSYVTCAVKAIQKGHHIFMMVASFQKPEPWHPTYQIPFPSVPPPEECELEEARYLREHDNPMTRILAAERQRSPIAVKRARANTANAEDGSVRAMYWMQAKEIPDYEAPFQKCILGYLSDMYLLGVATRITGLQKDIVMTSTIDHAVQFYSNSFDVGDWVLYSITCTVAGGGRILARGDIFSRNGSLIAVTTQEGVFRSNARGPEEQVKVNAKL